jgi:hypothetical protein
MMELTRSFETSVLTKATMRNVPEDGIFHAFFSLQDIKHQMRMKTFSVGGQEGILNLSRLDISRAVARFEPQVL